MLDIFVGSVQPNLRYNKSPVGRASCPTNKLEIRLEVVIASEGASFNEVHQLEVDGLIGQETHQLSRYRRGSFRGWQSNRQSNQRQYTQAAIESDIEARARDISRLIRVLRLKNEKQKHHESD